MRNPRYIFIWISLWLVAAVLPLAADEVSLTLEANRNQLYLGESFILQVNISGVSAAEPDLSQIKNANIRNLGKQNISKFSISFVNGQMTRQEFSGLIASYEITPLAAGPFRAGPVTVTANGKHYTAEGPVVTVTDIEKQELVKLDISPSRETVLIDEPFEITITAQIKCLPGKLAEAEPIFPDNPPHLTIPWLELEGIAGLTGPDLERMLNNMLIPNNRPGFAINNYTRQPDLFDFGSFLPGGRRRAVFALPRRIVRHDGNDYMEYYLTLSFTPKDEGNYVFGPAVFKGTVPVAPDNLGQVQGIAIFAVGRASTVRVIPPPEQGRPVSFTGAIGSNLAAKASLDTTVCSVGDPLKLTLELTGQVRFDKMLPPKLALQTNLLANFIVYDNTVQAVKRETSCQYIYTLRPTRAGAFQVPPIEVAYYDVKSRNYQTVLTDPIGLAVKSSTEVTASEILGDTNRWQTAKKTDDERTHKIAPAFTGAAGAEPAELLGHPVWLAVAGAGPGLFLIGLIILFYREHSAQYRAERRRHQAAAAAKRRLNAAIGSGAADLSRRSALAKADASAANLVCAVIRQYLAERLDAAAAGLTPEDARQLLTKAGAPQHLADELSRIFEHYFNAGFATQAELKDFHGDAAKLIKLIKAIEQALSAVGGYPPGLEKAGEKPQPV
ncbi:MAG: BatD family protein [Lentisphaerae bacterium]|nr:BatD family protein [Lentisphaerota bacterium]